MDDYPRPSAPMPFARDEREFTRSVMSILQSLTAERLLVFLGAVSSVLFGLLVFLLEAADGRAFADGGPFGRGGVALTLVFTVIFGFTLIYAGLMMREKPSEGGIVAFAVSLVLLIFGGVAGLLAGILGLVGGGMALLRHVKWA